MPTITLLDKHAFRATMAGDKINVAVPGSFKYNEQGDALLVTIVNDQNVDVTEKFKYELTTGAGFIIKGITVVSTPQRTGVGFGELLRISLIVERQGGEDRLQRLGQAADPTSVPVVSDEEARLRKLFGGMMANRKK